MSIYEIRHIVHSVVNDEPQVVLGSVFRDLVSGELLSHPGIDMWESNGILHVQWIYNGELPRWLENG